jgi:hypothetical protein
MSFSDALARLKTAAYCRQRGISTSKSEVERSDLSELINQFNLLDAKLRSMNEEHKTTLYRLQEMTKDRNFSRIEAAQEKAKAEHLSSWMLKNSAHTDNCSVLGYDEEGKHQACDCGFDVVYKTSAQCLSEIQDQASYDSLIALSDWLLKSKTIPFMVGSNEVRHYANKIKQEKAGN